MKYATVLKKGKNCHKNYSSVMSNYGFGDLTITQNGLTIFIPQSAIKKSNGAIKQSWKNKIINMTVEDALWLNQKIAA